MKTFAVQNGWRTSQTRTFHPKLQLWTSQPQTFNHEFFNSGLFNHEFLNHGVEKFMVERSGVEKSGLKFHLSRRLKDISTSEFSTPDFSTMNFSTPWLRNWGLGLKSQGLRCHSTQMSLDICCIGLFVNHARKKCSISRSFWAKLWGLFILCALYCNIEKRRKGKHYIVQYIRKRTKI